MADAPTPAYDAAGLDPERAKRIFLGLPPDAQDAARALMDKGMRGRDAVAHVYAQHMQNVARTSAEADALTDEPPTQEKVAAAALGAADSVGGHVARGLKAAPTVLGPLMATPVGLPAAALVGAFAGDDEDTKAAKAGKLGAYYGSGELGGDLVNAISSGFGLGRAITGAAPVVGRAIARNASRLAGAARGVGKGVAEKAVGKDAMEAITALAKGEAHGPVPDPSAIEREAWVRELMPDPYGAAADVAPPGRAPAIRFAAPVEEAAAPKTPADVRAQALADEEKATLDQIRKPAEADLSNLPPDEPIPADEPTPESAARMRAVIERDMPSKAQQRATEKWIMRGEPQRAPSPNARERAAAPFADKPAAPPAPQRMTNKTAMDWINSLPEEQRGKAAQYFAFMHELGVI